MAKEKKKSTGGELEGPDQTELLVSILAELKDLNTALGDESHSLLHHDLVALRQQLSRLTKAVQKQA